MDGKALKGKIGTQAILVHRPDSEAARRLRSLDPPSLGVSSPIAVFQGHSNLSS